MNQNPWLDKHEELMELDCEYAKIGSVGMNVSTARIQKATRLREGWLVRREERMEVDWVPKGSDQTKVE